MLKNVNSNLYLEVKDGAAQAGATVQQWGANGAQPLTNELVLRPYESFAIQY